MKHTVVSEWQSGLHFVTDSLGGNVIIDANEEVGGKGLGKRPKPLMLVSLAGCTGIDVASILKKMRLEVEDFRVEVHGALTDEEPKMYHTVKVDYYFGGEEVADNKDKIEKAVNLSIDKYCGVYHMFKQFSDVSFEIHYL